VKCGKSSGDSLVSTRISKNCRCAIPLNIPPGTRRKRRLALMPLLRVAILLVTQKPSAQAEFGAIE
jgi:hypothetical protein